MAAQRENVIRLAEQLLQEGRRLEARSLLVRYIRQDTASAQGWWLLSRLVTDEKQQMDCLERVLMLDPDHSPARALLTKLKEGSASGPSAPPFFESTSFGGSMQGTVSAGRGPETDSATSSFSRPQPVQQASARRRSSKMPEWILPASLFLVLLCVSIGGFGFITVLQMQQQAVPLFAFQPMEGMPVSAPLTLPPTWTATITETPVPSRTPLPMEMPGSVPTFAINTLVRPVGPVTGLFAPDFTLKNVVSGNQVSMSDFNGRPVVIFFWATWCPHCANEMSPMQKVYTSYKGRGLAVLAVDVGESAAQARSYRSSRGLTFTVLNDSNQAVAGTYHISAFPTNFFIDRDGRIASIIVGELGYANLNSKVQSLLP